MARIKKMRGFEITETEEDIRLVEMARDAYDKMKERSKPQKMEPKTVPRMGGDDPKM